MTRGPARCTLFPYLLLFRSEEHTSELQSHDNLVCRLQTCALPIRSEEHTSELQPHDNLVCRLLLENKYAPLRPPVAAPLSCDAPITVVAPAAPRRRQWVGRRCVVRRRPAESGGGLGLFC